MATICKQNIEVNQVDTTQELILDNNISFYEGATYLPHIKQIDPFKIEISWTNNRGLPNPEPVTIEGKEGQVSTEQLQAVIDRVQNIEHDKLGVVRYTVATDKVSQLEATDIISNYGNYEGQYIEFLTNGDMPNKTIAYGYLVTDKEGNQFLIVYNLNGTITQFNKSYYEKHQFETYSYVNEVVDLDNLTIDQRGDAPFMATVNNAYNRPFKEETSEKGIVTVVAYAVNQQIQFYKDVENNQNYYRIITGEADRHTFNPWVKTGNGELLKEVEQARTSYFGKTYDTLDERIDNDINGTLEKVNVVNYKGTEINAKNTIARNLNVNGNKFEVQGKTKQNLFDSSLLIPSKVTQSGITFERLKDGSIHIYGNNAQPFNQKYSDQEFNLPNGQYFLSGNRIILTIEHSPSRTEYVLNREFTVDSTITSINAKIQIDETGQIDEMIYPQLEVGSKQTPYTPFGLYSDPQTVVKTWGANWLSIEDFEPKSAGPITYSMKNGVLNLKGKTTGGTTIRIPANPNLDYEQYTFSNDTAIPTNVFISLDEKQGTKLNSSTQKTTWTVDTKYVNLLIYIGANVTIDKDFKLMLVKGSQVAKHQPYEEHLVTIPRPLRSAGNVYDKFYLKDGKGTVENVMNKIIIDGTEKVIVANYGGGNRFTITPNEKILLAKETNNGQANQGMIYSMEIFGRNRFNKLLGIYKDGKVYLRWDEYKTAEELKAHLKLEPLEIIYELENPTTEQIDCEDVVSLNGTTNMATLDKAPKVIDVDMPSDVKAVTQEMMAENRTLKAENQKLSKQVEQTQANTDYIAMMTGVE